MIPYRSIWLAAWIAVGSAGFGTAPAAVFPDFPEQPRPHELLGTVENLFGNVWYITLDQDDALGDAKAGNTIRVIISANTDVGTSDRYLPGTQVVIHASRDKGLGLAWAALDVRTTRPGARDLFMSELIRKVIPSIARVIVPMGNQTAYGTAFVFYESGYLLLTNCHVVSDKNGTVINEVEVEFRESAIPESANVVGCDKLSDLAVLKVAYKRHPAIPAASVISVGDEVGAIGFALNISGAPSVTRGIISGVGRSLKGISSGLIQTDASINHGNSGGPLLNIQGQFVGVNTFTNETTISAGTDLSNIKNEPLSLDTPYGIFYARDARLALPFAREIAAKGWLPRVDIGLSDVISVSREDARELLKVLSPGVFIKAFRSGSPLQAAGLREGDVITGLGPCREYDIGDCYAVGSFEDVGELTNRLADLAINKSKTLRVMAERPPRALLRPSEETRLLRETALATTLLRQPYNGL